MKKEILYQEIARTIACQIKKGVWKAGEKLPSLRTISNENGVSLNTAIQAYYELEKRRIYNITPKIRVYCQLQTHTPICSSDKHNRL